MTEINIQIRDADTFDNRGKTWRPVAFRKPKVGEWYIGDCGVFLNSCSTYPEPRLIVTEVKPLHRTPTDEDALRRPACEYRDRDDHDWHGNTMDKLLYVTPKGEFIVLHSNGACAYWRQCRIPNET